MTVSVIGSATSGPALLKTNNLSDVADTGTSRANVQVPVLTPVAAVAVANVTSLSGLQTVDGYTLQANDLILLTAQSTASANGLYLAQSGAWTRPTESATGVAIKARTVTVIQGTVYGASTWLLQTDATVTVDTTAQTWVLAMPVTTVTGQLPAANGSDDTTVLNAAIAVRAALGGGVMRGYPGAQYKISAPLIVGSGITLDMTGCTITLIAGNDVNMLNNTSTVTPTATATDVSCSANSITLTSTTLAAVAVVGGAVSVPTKGPNGAAWYGTITAVNTSTHQITLNTTCLTAGTNVTASLYNTRDSRIRLVGGTWNAGTRTSPGNYNNAHTFRLRRIDGLTITGNMKFITAGLTGGGGGSNGVDLCDITNFTIKEVNLSGTGGGLMIQGPISGGTIKSITGTTNDDMVALSTVNYAGYDCGGGNVSEITVSDIVPSASWVGVKLQTGSDLYNTWTLSGIGVNRIRGTAQRNPVALQDYPNAGALADVVIDDISTQAGIGFPNVLLNITNTTTVKIRNLYSANGSRNMNAGVIGISQNVTDLAIDGVYFNTTSASQNYMILVASGKTVGSLKLRNVYGDGSAPWYVVALAGTSAVVTNLVIDGVIMPAGTESLINNPSGTITNMQLSNCPQFLTGVATLSAGTVAVANTAITANSRVRVTNIAASGTVGALSVAISAGVGFTINSTSGTDAGKILWEIVEY